MLINIDGDCVDGCGFSCLFSNIINSDEAPRCIVPDSKIDVCWGNPAIHRNCPLLQEDITISYKPKIMEEI